MGAVCGNSRKVGDEQQRQGRAHDRRVLERIVLRCPPRRDPRRPNVSAATASTGKTAKMPRAEGSWLSVRNRCTHPHW